jgi:energy-coupling factor transporter ATP-binding protein EcfA2
VFFSLEQIKKSLTKLQPVHPFFGITYLVFKKGNLPVGATTEFPIDARNKEFLDQHYKPDKNSEWYYRVFRISDKDKLWVASDYPSSGLQSVNTRTFKDAFIHERNTEIWGWKPNYVQVLKSHLRKKLIPAFDLAVWLYKEKNWTENTTADDIINILLDDYSISETEKKELFDLSLTNILFHDQLFQEESVSWEQLREITGPPPDAEPIEQPITHIEMILENVRSLSGHHIIPIKPLTLLIGENSSGKSTFLATLSVVCNTPQYPVWPRFNDPPYNLGGYDTIATYKSDSDGQAGYFAIGHRVKRGADRDYTEVLAKYINNRGDAELSDFSIKSPDGSFRLYLKEKDIDYYTARLSPTGKGKPTEFRVRRGSGNYRKTDFLSFIISNILDIQMRVIAGRRKERRDFDLISLIKTLAHITLADSLSIAPIRTKPSRTYDQASDDYSPEGSHIPYLLARILSEDANSDQKRGLKNALEQFGKESGLFEKIEVKQLGDYLGDPFQILVTPSGISVNLQDVGYGVSQALPVIVQSVLVDAPDLMLLQQPEVHLHPKAQAALGSFFTRLISKSNKQFVIETHSDFIVDRIRQEVASGAIDFNSVGILFFDKQDFETKVHVISLDKLGNILNAPPSYREFFLREELNLLTGMGAID